MSKQSETKKRSDEKSGKYHYNPVNMSGKEAGIVEEVQEKVAEEREQPDGDGRERAKRRKSGD